jgi:micrococcal nuclease
MSVGDGDTHASKAGLKNNYCRLGCIDAPESTQALWGQQSANRLKQLLPVGQAVQVREIDHDQYGRTIADLYLSYLDLYLSYLAPAPKTGFLAIVAT